LQLAPANLVIDGKTEILPYSSTANAEPAGQNAKQKAFCIFHRRYLLLARMLVDVCFLSKLTG
jgi:hypothetical protein